MSTRKRSQSGRKSPPRRSTNGHANGAATPRSAPEPLGSGIHATDEQKKPSAPNPPHPARPKRSIFDEKRREELATEIKTQVLIGLLATLLLIVLTNVVEEHTYPGQQLKKFGYDIVERNFLSTNPNLSPASKIAIVDISGMPVDSSALITDKSSYATSRPLLISVLQRLHSDGAAATGIDIDFSPLPDSKTGYVLPEDSEFFDQCLDLSSGANGSRRMPVYLGVGRQAGASADLWLGDSRYEPLAAGILVPASDTSRLISWTKTDSPDAKLLSMGMRLSGNINPLSSGDRSLWTRILAAGLRAHVIETSGADEEFPALFDSFLVDYRPLTTRWLPAASQLSDANPSSLEAGIYSYRDILSGNVSKDALRGRVAILGDIRRPELSDVAQVPGINQAVPGVLLHASACATIAGQPLYRMTPLGRVAVDAIMAILMIGGTGILRYFVALRYGAVLSDHPITIVTTVCAALCVIVIATMFVGRTHLFWSDFLFVTIGTLIHPSLHHHLHHAGAYHKNVRAKGWRVIFEDEKNEGEKPHDHSE